MTEEQLQELLREMRDESIPPDSLVRMRARVAARTSRRFGWRRIAFLAPIPAVAVLLALWFLPQQRTPADLPPLVARFDEIPPPAASAPAPAPVRRARHRLRANPLPAPARGAAEIRIQTDDPDIVILLTGE